MKSPLRHLCLLMAGMLSISTLVFPQQDLQSAPQGRGLERVEQFKKIRLMEVLNLDEQTSIKFFARYNKYEDQLRDLRQKQVHEFAQIQSLRKSKAADTEYDKVVNDLLTVEGQFEDVKTKYIGELKEVLTSKQLAEYLAFEYRFQQNLRDLAREVQHMRQQPMTR